jgi:glutamyl-tRNA synthetase
VLRPRAETLAELADQAHYFFAPVIAYDDDARRRLAAGQSYLEDLERAFSRLEFYDDDAIDDLLHEYVQGQAVPIGKVLMPLRVALTGTSQAPSVVELVAILGRQRTLARLGQALESIQQGLPDDDPDRLRAEAEAAAKAAEAAKTKRRPPAVADRG